jgi:hypothetical protein
MPLISLKNKQELDLSSLKDGLIAIFTGSLDSDFMQTQMAKYQELQDQAKNLPINILFVTDQEGQESDQDFVFYASDRELINKSKRIANQDTLQENIIILVKSGNEINHGDQKESPEADEEWVEGVIQAAKNFMQSDPDEDGYYKWGQIVPETADYLCKDCGYVEEFKAGTIFPICETCIAGEPTGPSGPSEGYWEKI